MKKITAFAILLFVLSGCGRDGKEMEIPYAYTEESELILDTGSLSMDLAEMESLEGTEAEMEVAESGTNAANAFELEPVITEIDLAEYFQDLNGCAVFYEPEEALYEIYRTELAERRTSPCSTFKIITSALGLEAGVIDPEDSVRKWSGESYWRDVWNRDIDFADAFRTSCVWYFREVADDLGKERMQNGLDQLAYGNTDCSEWDGRAARGLTVRALSGFWIESSLKISPKEQTEVMAELFGVSSSWREETRNVLREVMRLEETQTPVYGKTGLGKENGKTADAWFVGFAEPEGKQLCFAVWLGDSEKPADSTLAKEIALRILRERYGIG